MGLYDLNWNHIRDITVVKKDFTLPAGEFPIRFTRTSKEGTPWLEFQLFTKGEAMEISPAGPLSQYR